MRWDMSLAIERDKCVKAVNNKEAGQTHRQATEACRYLTNRREECQRRRRAQAGHQRIDSQSSMENNVFSAFSFSGGPARREALRRGGANLPEVVNEKRGDNGNASAFSVGGHPMPAAASHAVISESHRVKGKQSHNNAANCGPSVVLDLSSEKVLLKDGENSRNARPGSQRSGSQNFRSLTKIEKKEAAEEEELRVLPQEMCEIQEENAILQVKEEILEPVESLPKVNKRRQAQGNRGREEEKCCEDLEDFGGGDLSFRSAESNELEVKGLKMKRQNTKLTKGSRFGSSQFRPPPPNWEEALQGIRGMRTGRDAPVDLLGPAQLVDRNADLETQKFQILVAAMISSQTRDAVTAAAMKRLHALSSGLTVKHLAGSDVSIETLEELLKPVGFYRQKAKQLKSMADILIKSPYLECVPSTLDELMKLPGVGPKVGLLVLWVGFGMGEVGLIVDTNVRRVCCRVGWVPEGSSAEQVRHEVESWLPRDKWAEASFLLVGFGQQICKPIGPKCKECQLQNFCPSAFKCGKKVITEKIQS